MTTKKPDLYKAPEEGVVLKYELSTVPLQDQVGHVRRWCIQVYENATASWHRMREASATSSKKLTGSIPVLSNISEPQPLVVGLAGVTGLLLARKRGTVRRILYPITAIGVTGAAMWLTYPRNRTAFMNYCYNTWNDVTNR